MIPDYQNPMLPLLLTLENSRKRADRMEQAILGKAFRGELVGRDPNDEPASVLLERIKGEKGEGKNGRKKHD